MEREEVQSLLRKCLTRRLIDSYRWQDEYLIFHAGNASFRLRGQQIRSVLRVLLENGWQPKAT